jgi:Heparinase II/III-like protein
MPEGPFAWSALPRIVAEQWIEGRSFDLFVGSHDGYTRFADPAIHRRFVFHAHGGPWMIRDMVEGREIHEVEVSWHFAPDLALTRMEGGFVAAADPSANHQKRESALRLALLWATEASANGFVETGCVSPAYGSRKPAPVVRLRAQARLPLELATLLAPLQGSSAGNSAFGLLSSEGSPVHGYRYSEDATTHSFFFSQAGKPWTLNAWECDAAFLYCRYAEGRILHLVMVDGSFVRYRGKPLIQHGHAIQRFEWLKRGDAGVTYCSNQTSVAHALDQEPELDSVS